MIGFLAFDEILCDITRIELEHGELVIYAKSRHPGNYTVDTDADATIYAPDSSIIAHIPSVAQGKHPQTTRDGYIDARIPINISIITSRQTSTGQHINLEQPS